MNENADQGPASGTGPKIKGYLELDLKVKDIDERLGLVVLEYNSYYRETDGTEQKERVTGTKKIRLNHGLTFTFPVAEDLEIDASR